LASGPACGDTPGRPLGACDDNHPARRGHPLVYQCALPLSRQALTYVADLLRGHLKKIGSRWRKLPPGKIALIVPTTLRHDHRLAGMAGGNSVSASAIHRWT
jgi:hypothetical protein